MEKYFVIQITKASDSQVYATAITVKDAYDEAKMLYYQIMASIYATPSIEHAIVKIDSAYGSTLMMETIIPEEPNDLEGDE